MFRLPDVDFSSRFPPLPDHDIGIFEAFRSGATSEFPHARIAYLTEKQHRPDTVGSIHQMDPTQALPLTVRLTLLPPVTWGGNASTYARWTHRMQPYSAVRTSAQMYARVSGAKSPDLRGLDQIYCGVYAPKLRLLMLLLRCRPSTQVCDAVMSSLMYPAILFWCMVRNRFMEYTPHVYNQCYSENWPAFTVLLNPTVDFTGFDDDLEESPCMNERTDMEAEAANCTRTFGAFFFRVLQLICKTYPKEAGNMTAFLFCDKKLKRNGGLMLYSRRWRECEVLSAVESYNQYILDKYPLGKKDNKLLRREAKKLSVFPHAALKQMHVTGGQSTDGRDDFPYVFFHLQVAPNRPVFSYHSEDVSRPSSICEHIRDMFPVLSKTDIKALTVLSRSIRRGASDELCGPSVVGPRLLYSILHHKSPVFNLNHTPPQRLLQRQSLPETSPMFYNPTSIKALLAQGRNLLPTFEKFQRLDGATRIWQVKSGGLPLCDSGLCYEGEELSPFAQVLLWRFLRRENGITNAYFVFKAATCICLQEADALCTAAHYMKLHDSPMRFLHRLRSCTHQQHLSSQFDIQEAKQFLPRHVVDKISKFTQEYDITDTRPVRVPEDIMTSLRSKETMAALASALEVELHRDKRRKTSNRQLQVDVLSVLHAFVNDLPITADLSLQVEFVGMQMSLKDFLPSFRERFANMVVRPCEEWIYTACHPLPVAYNCSQTNDTAQTAIASIQSVVNAARKAAESLVPLLDAECVHLGNRSGADMTAFQLIAATASTPATSQLILEKLLMGTSQGQSNGLAGNRVALKWRRLFAASLSSGVLPALLVNQAFSEFCEQEVESKSPDSALVMLSDTLRVAAANAGLKVKAVWSGLAKTSFTDALMCKLKEECRTFTPLPSVAHVAAH
jgi:hypothetical protein